MTQLINFSHNLPTEEGHYLFEKYGAYNVISVIARHFDSVGKLVFFVYDRKSKLKRYHPPPGRWAKVEFIYLEE